MKIKEELEYLLKLSRPRFWLYLGGPALLGLISGSNSPEQLTSFENLLVFLYFFFPANIMLYGINDFFDRDIDEENPKKDGKEASYTSHSFTDLSIVASTIMILPLTYFLGPVSYLPTVAFLFLSVFYSAPPFRFKTKPFLDSLSNGLYLMPFVIVYTGITNSYPPFLTVIGGWLWTMAMHTFSAIPDINPDRKAGIRTTATFLGRKKTYIYCGLVWTLSAVIMGLWNWRVSLVFSIYPILLAAFYFSDLSDSEAYWYYPWINAILGMILTVSALWVLFNG